VDELKEMGVWTFAAEAGGADYHSADFDLPCAIVMGSEGGGVSRLVKEKCDFLVSIPMYGKVNSLNVSTAASVLLFDAAYKQRKK
jgi:23S rRNA (guanosine2251-2'-O)-methyltransferase